MDVQNRGRVLRLIGKRSGISKRPPTVTIIGKTIDICCLRTAQQYRSILSDDIEMSFFENRAFVAQFV